MVTSASLNGQTVLVTGINGYIASHIGRQLLKKGFTVRGTSRSASAGPHLCRSAFKGFEENYEHFVVPDMTVEGAFDEAAQGVSGIIHTASPISFDFQTLDEFLVPAVNGSLSILRSALKAGPELKSVVITSSVTAIVSRDKPQDYDFSEDDWNDWAEKAVRKEFSPSVAYSASKTAAERAIWTWGKENKHAFSLSAVNPTIVMGPPIVFPDSPAKLNETLKPVWEVLTRGTIQPPVGRGAYIDVRDVAAMHIWCIEHPEDSDQQRYMLAAGKGTPQGVADFLRKACPDRRIEAGEPGTGSVPGYGFAPGESTFYSTKALRALGWERFTRFEQMVLDTVAAFEKQWPELIENIQT
ncbi:MAG: hypothetical protein Q9160_003535 [Pyrenula sp. 1 TL-2023]